MKNLISFIFKIKLFVLVWICSLFFFGVDFSQAAGTIRTDFEGSNLDSWVEPTPDTWDLTIKYDMNSTEYRWYSFKIEGASGTTQTFNITNAGSANASGAWSFNRPVYSQNSGATWGRISNTSYIGGVFSFVHTIGSNSEWLALGVVYDFSRWESLVITISSNPLVTSVTELTQTLQGRPLHLLTITDPSVDDSQKKAVWITARQHPAEIGGSWVCEGLIDWLLGGSPEADNLLRESIFKIAGFMNPDGVVLGHYRLNTLGLNLNREWNSTTETTSPTIFAVRQAMLDFQSGGGVISTFFDLHSYSSYHKNFCYYANAFSSSQVLYDDARVFLQSFANRNSDFTFSQSESTTATNLGIAAQWGQQILGVPSMTFETSYQDINYGPDSGTYMTRERFKALGESLGQTIDEHYFSDTQVSQFMLY